MMENFTPPPFVTFAIPFFFLLIFIEMFIGFYQKKAYYRLNDSISDLSLGILSQLWGLFLKGISLFAYFYIYENLRFATVPRDSVWGWIACIILWDFCYYWFHRISHEVNLFWAGHIIHHTSEEYNLIVALRQSGIGGFLSWIFYLPLAFIGFDPWVFLAAGQINLIYQFWVHTKAVKSIGKVGEFLLSTPAHHRVHHAINPKYIDRNHGGILIIWDRLFGTFQKEEEECVYGTVKPLASFNPIWANFQYLVQMAQMSWNAHGILNKLKVIYKPPGWVPPMEKGGSSQFLKPPEVDPKKFKKYDPNIPQSISYYALVWFILVLVASFSGLLFIGKMNQIQIIALTVWVTASLLSFAWLLEARKISLYWEPIRLGMGVFALSFFTQNQNIYLGYGILVLISFIAIFQMKGSFKNQEVRV
jgi:alkylglycerol monooxygenase